MHFGTSLKVHVLNQKQVKFVYFGTNLKSCTKLEGVQNSCILRQLSLFLIAKELSMHL